MKNDKYMIRRAGTEDAEAPADRAIQMWTDHVAEDLTEEFRRAAADDDAV